VGRGALGHRARGVAIGAACRSLRPLFRAPRGPQRSPRRVLILRRCCLGDVLMTTPLLRAIEGAYPDATITYAVGRWSAAALGGEPGRHAILRLPEHPHPRDWARIVGRLRRGDFDLAIVPERSPLPALATALAGIPRRVGLDSSGRGFALTDRVPAPAIRHETDLSLDLARALGIAASDRRPRYLPSAAARARVAALIAARGMDGPIFVVHPGGGANPGVTMDAKRWPPERFAAVGAALLARHGGTLAVVGAASDAATVAATVAACPPGTHDLGGALSLDELGAFCARARLYLGNDAGTTHLAEACGAPTLVVFGPTDPAQYGPTDGIGEAVWDPVACGPYVQRGDLTRLGDEARAVRCIDAIPVAAVLDAAARVLARGGAGPAVPT
jgi:ADP-heptose:LPS heptosyltransferase